MVEEIATFVTAIAITNVIGIQSGTSPTGYVIFPVEWSETITDDPNNIVQINIDIDRYRAFEYEGTVYNYNFKPYREDGVVQVTNTRPNGQYAPQKIAIWELTITSVDGVEISPISTLYGTNSVEQRAANAGFEVEWQHFSGGTGGFETDSPISFLYVLGQQALAFSSDFGAILEFNILGYNVWSLLTVGGFLAYAAVIAIKWII